MAKAPKKHNRVTIFKRDYGTSVKLWLNYRINGKRYREPLNIYLEKGTSPLVKVKNLNKLHMAEQIANKKEEEILKIENGICSERNLTMTLCEYAHRELKEQIKSEHYTKNIAAVVKTVIEFAPDIRMIDINREFYKRYLDFLRIVKKQSPNTIITNSKILAAIIHRAFLDKVITNMPDFTGIRPKSESHERQYLTLDELRLLANTPALEIVKNAFLFSCFTGLRYSDIISLEWDDIRNNRITKRMQKTGEIVYIPLNKNALKFMPKQNAKLVFKDLPSVQTISRILSKWVQQAGITKKITFHCVRHTFATLALANGADLYTVSKLLGHSEITTTQIYAKVLDEGRKKAVDAIPEL